MRNFLCRLLSVSAIAPFIAAPASADLYRHIMFRESPYAPYQGIHELDPNLSDEVAHFDFDHDEQGRLVAITHQMGDVVIANNGNWDSFIWFAPQVRIAYGDGTETHTYFNAAGEQIHAHGRVWQARYTLDADGRRVALAFFDEDGEPSENAWNVHSYDWRPSDDGHIFERRYNLAGEMQPIRPVFHFYEVKLEYDTDGRIAFVRNYGTDHTPTNNDSGAGIDRITYDLDGNFVRWQVYDTQGNPVEGNRPMVHLGEHLYDDDGNKIGLRGFDRYGNEIPFASGELYSLNEYDSRGFRTDYRTFNAQREQGMHLRYRFNEETLRSEEIRALSDDGRTVSHPALGGAAIIRFGSDEHGARRMERLNPDGSDFQPDTD